MKHKVNKKPSAVEVLRERADTFLRDEAKLLQKHGLNKRIVVTFPNSKTVPKLGRLAVWLLKKSKAVIDTEFGLIHK